MATQVLKAKLNSAHFTEPVSMRMVARLTKHGAYSSTNSRKETTEGMLQLSSRAMNWASVVESSSVS